MNTVKDLKTIDKEIAMTKKQLKRLNNQMCKNQDFINNRIFAIEEESKQIFNASTPVKFNETEVKKYFEIHLDSLEDKIKGDKSNSDAPKKMWTPLQIEYPPVINVETSSKAFASDQLELEFDFEELSILELFEIKPICIMGKPVEQVSFCDKIKKYHEPTRISALYDSPELHKGDSMNDKKHCIFSKEIIIARTTLDKWKKYVKQRKIQRFSDNMKNKALHYLLKKVLTTWHSHTTDVKLIKEARIKQINDNFSEKENNDSKNTQDNTRDDCFLTKPMNICSKNNVTKKCVIANDNNTSANDSEAKVNDFENKRQGPNNPDITNIHRKIVTPECVGLSNAVEKPRLQNTKTTKNKVKGFHNCLRNSSTNSEQFHFRYAAQEKIIAQQLAVIEKQKQIILDLQVENLEKKSALQKITVETHLQIANAMMERKQKCHVNNTNVDAETVTHIVKNQCVEDKSLELANRKNQCVEDKSLELTNRMLSRHEYCKQLAEKTKNRKKRIEEEKAQMKAELEEREKIEKEEKKKQRLKQLRLKQVLAEEGSKLQLAKKQRIHELTEKAVNHYNRIILGRMFHKLKTNMLETHIKTHQCKIIFEKKLLKRTFHILKTHASNSLSIKYEAAGQFYKERLIERYWCYWRQLHQEYKIKVQVSVDMFELSLQRRMFHRWQDFVAEQYLQNCYKNELADRLYRRKLLQHCLKKWREFPRLMLAEREREMRLRAWRRAVQEIIPDFKPVRVDPLEI